VALVARFRAALRPAVIPQSMKETDTENEFGDPSRIAAKAWPGA